MLIGMIFLEIKQQYLCCSRKKPINFQATTDSERERHVGIPPRDEEEMEMSDDSSTLTGESLEAVTPTITPRYHLGNNLFYFVVCFDIHVLIENSFLDLISFFLWWGVDM